MIVDNAPPHELTKKIAGKVWNIPFAKSDDQLMQERFRVINIVRDEQTGEVLLHVLLMNAQQTVSKRLLLRWKTIICMYLEKYH